jgi:hypothetical protein
MVEETGDESIISSARALFEWAVGLDDQCDSAFDEQSCMSVFLTPFPGGENGSELPTELPETSELPAETSRSAIFRSTSAVSTPPAVGSVGSSSTAVGSQGSVSSQLAPVSSEIPVLP